MDTSAHNDAAYWAQEIGRLRARLDDFEARFEAEYQILRRAVDTQLGELRAAVRILEGRIAALGPDAYAQKIADEVAELKLKGDLAYELLQERLHVDSSEDANSSDAGPPQ